MLAAGNNQWTFVVTAVAVLTVLWIAVRILLNSKSNRTEAMRHRLTDGSLSPRNQHYYFVHGAMRALAAEDPDKLVIAMAAPEAEDFLRKVWRDVGNMLADRGEELIAIAPDGLEAIPARVAGRPVAIIQLPEPRATTEAFFVAIVLNHDIDEPAKPAPQPAAYFFTLEKGFSIDGSLRTVFCEWVGESHRNFGDGPPADPRAFLDHIGRHLGQIDSRSAQATGESKESP